MGLIENQEFYNQEPFMRGIGIYTPVIQHQADELSIPLTFQMMSPISLSAALGEKDCHAPGALPVLCRALLEYVLGEENMLKPDSEFLSPWHLTQHF